MKQSKRKYVPDLVKQSVICETNYARLLKLLPEDQEWCEYRISWHQHQFKVRIQRDEEFAFTSTYLVSYRPDTESQWVNPQTLVVRLYHDARMAEVVSMLGRRQLAGRYAYPNPDMHQPDEKFQLNLYLSEWLTQCFSTGEVVLPQSLVC